MGINQKTVGDWSGGVTERLNAADFTDRQSAVVAGLVLESETELRTQWAMQTVLAGSYTDVAVLDGLCVLKDAAGAFWWFALPADGAASPLGVPTLTQVGAFSEPSLRMAGTVPYRAVGTPGWVNALMLNGSETGSDVRLLWNNGGTLQADTLSEQYPPNTSVSGCPKANVAATWGDFIVLGDVEWLADDSLGFSSGNAVRFPHGLWFSQPGKVDRWDTIDTEFVAQRGDDNAILDLVATERGLIVVTAAGVWMLRGNPNDHWFEEVRPGIAPTAAGASAQWSLTGGVVFADDLGRVWHVTGDDFVRLDDPLLPCDGDGAVVADFGEHLLVSRGGRLWAFRGFRGDGAWTELVLPGSAPTAMVADDLSVYMLCDGDVVRFTRGLDAERGMLDGAESLTFTLGSRTFSLGAHLRGFWHRWGLRAQGPGTLTYAASRDEPALAVGTDFPVLAAPAAVAERAMWPFPAHGPSDEASFVAHFTGDVRVESLTSWSHGGREER